jgi:hypothetical protein
LLVVIVLPLNVSANVLVISVVKITIFGDWSLLDEWVEFYWRTGVRIHIGNVNLIGFLGTYLQIQLFRNMVFNFLGTTNYA